MKKVLEILQSLSEARRLAFIATLSRGNYLRRLTKALLLENPTSFEEAWQSYRPDSPFKLSRIKKDLVQLKDLLYAYLEDEFLSAHPLQRFVLRLEQLRDFEESSNFEAEWNRFRKLTLPSCLGEQELESLYRCYHTRYLYLVDRKDRLKTASEIASIRKQLISLTRHLHYFRELRWHVLLPGEMPHPGTSKATNEWEKDNLYLAAFQLLAHPEGTVFEELERVISRAGFDGKRVEGSEICLQLLNRLISDYKRNGNRNLGVIYRLYKLMLDRNWLENDKGEIGFRHFLNFPLIAAKAGQLDEARYFIQQRKFETIGTYWKDAYLYNNAWLSFQEGKFKNCLQLMEAWDYHKDFFQIKARFLIAKANFELGLLNETERSLDQFRKWFLRAGNLGPGRKEGEAARLKFFLRLLRLPPADSAKINVFLADLEASLAFDKDWLRGKAMERF